MKKRLSVFFLILCMLIGLVPQAEAASKVKVALNKSSMTMTVKTCTTALQATVSPSSSANRKVCWKSSNTSVVSVSGNGELSANKVGTATITAYLQSNHSVKATCKVTVKAANIKVEKVSLSKGSITMTVGNSTTALKATVSPSNAANKSVGWKSSNTSVVTVSSSGELTAKKAGTATITVYSKENTKKKATCKVTVKAASKNATKVTLNKSSVELVGGKKYTLKATVYPETANKKVTWSSSNTKVATVSSEGVVTPKGYGTATITAKTVAGGKLATCKITIPKTKTITKSNTVTSEWPYYAKDKITIVVDGLTGKILSADVHQTKRDDGLVCTLNAEGCKVLYTCDDYVLIRTSWNIGLGVWKIKAKLTGVDVEYKMYADGTLKEIKRKTH